MSCSSSFRALVLALAALLGGAACGLGHAGGVCLAKTSQDLAAFRDDDGCLEISVIQTQLTTLAGLEGADKDVTVEGNAVLRDVSAITRGRHVLVTGPQPDLHDVAVTGTSITLQAEQAVNGIDLRVRQPPTGDAILAFQGNEKPQHLHATCADAACSVNMQVISDTFDSFDLAFDDSISVTTFSLDTQISAWEFLQGIGVPAQIQLERPQDLALLQEWRAWLDQHGFVGSFQLCSSDGSSPCAEVLAN